MRWLLLGGSVLGFSLFFAAKSPGVMGLGVVIGFGCLFFALFAFASARIASTSRPDTTMLTDKDISALQASLRKARAGQATPPAGGGSTTS